MTIEEVIKVCKKLNLEPDQVLSMYYRSKNKRYPLFLDSAKYNTLVNRGLAKHDKPTERYLNLVSDIVNYIPKNARNIDIDIKFQDMLISVSEVLDVTKNVAEDAQERVKKFFKDDDRLINLYFTWLNLFPTTSGEKNQAWENLFGVPYTGVPLRKVIDSNLRNFRKIAYSKDLGLYIMATYLFIRSNINNGVAYIPKITNFILEQESTYSDAKTLLDPLDSDGVINLFELANTESLDSAIGAGMIQG